MGNKKAKIKVIFSVFLIFVVLTSSVYFLMPDKVRIDIENTRTKYSVWEDGWTLAAIEYVNLFDGTTKMRAKNRELIYWNDSDFAYTRRKSIWKDNITTIQTYKFDIDSSEVEQFPVSNEFECFNCNGKIVHYEIRDILYDGETKVIESPFSFGYNMKIEWGNGAYYSKVFQQKVASDKIIIKYRPINNSEKYSIRLFDPPKYSQSYDELTKTMTIKEDGLEVINIKLDSPQDKKVIRGKDRLVAEFTTDNQIAISKFLNKLELYDIKDNMKHFDRDYILRVKEFYQVEINDYETICKENISLNGSIEYDCYENFTGSHSEERFNWEYFNNSLGIGKTTIGIFTDVLPNEQVEWIPTFLNVRVHQWATWTESYEENLLAVWNFEEASGDLIDVWDGNNNGTNNGADYQATGIYNYAWDFERDELDYVSVADDSEWKTGELTTSVWVKPEAIVNYNWIYAKGEWVTETYVLYIGSTRISCAGKSDAAATVAVLTTYGLNTGAWAHLSCVYNSSGITMFINDTFIGTTACPDTCSWGSSDSLSIGYSGAGSYFDGLIDELYFWNETKDASFISDLYDSGAGTFYRVGPIFPNVIINTPLNQSYSTNSITFNITAVDYTLMDSCWYTINSGVTNYTLTNSTYVDDYTNTNSTMAQESHTANFYCNDSSSNINDSESVTFFIDSIIPNINLVYPINTSYNLVQTELNFTRSDTNLAGCWYSTDSGATNSSYDTNCNNITGLNSGQGSSTWIVYANDTVGNENQSSVTFFVDSINPDIEIVLPTNNTYPSVTVDVNYTVSDTHLEVCWYSNDTMTLNTTLPDCGNITDVTWSEGQHNVTVWANDSLNNVNFSSVTFIIDTIYPEISIVYPTNTTYSFTNHSLEYTYIEINCDSVWYSLDSGATNSSREDCGTNWTLNASFGSNTWTVYINDTTNNLNSSSVTFSVRTFLFLNGVEQSLDAEFGTQINLSLNNSLGEIFFDIDHPEFGTNYSNLSSFLFNVSYFHKNLFSDDSSSKTFTYTNSSSYDFLYLNVSSHQYDEADYLSLNISGVNDPENIGFYKINTTSFDRAFYGKLIGFLINIKTLWDTSTGVNLRLNSTNLSFDNYGEKLVYIFLDDNANLINFTLNISGYKNGFEFLSTLYDGTYDDNVLSTTRKKLGCIVPAGENLQEFTIDDFEDGSINTTKWTKTANVNYNCVSGDCYDYVLSNSEASGKLKMATTMQEDFSESNEGADSVNNYLYLNQDESQIISTEEYFIEFSFNGNGDERYYDDECNFRNRVYLTGQNIYSIISGVCDDCIKYYESIGTITINASYFNETHYKVVINGTDRVWGTDECGDYEIKRYWNTGRTITTYEWCTNTNVPLDSIFYITKDFTTWEYVFYIHQYSRGYFEYYDDADICTGTGVRIENYPSCNEWVSCGSADDETSCENPPCGFKVGSCTWYTGTTRRAGCDNLENNFYLHNINENKYSITTSTYYSKSIFDSAANINLVTMQSTYNGPATFYISTDDGDNYQNINLNTSTPITNPGKHVKWASVFGSGGYDVYIPFITYINLSADGDYPSNITFDFGNDGINDASINGYINETNGSVQVDLTSAILTTAFTTESPSVGDHTYLVPLEIHSDTAGVIEISNINLTYNPNPIVLNITTLQWELSNASGFMNFSIPVGTYIGNITFDDLRYYYAGGNKTYEILAHNLDYTSNKSFNLTYFYSRWDYNFCPVNVDYLAFIPKSPTDKNVTPYGQTNSIPILNITNYGYGGRNVNLSIYLNETLSCVNLTMSTNSTKTDGNIINNSWIYLNTNFSYLDTTDIFMFADFGCNYSNWYLFYPSLYLKQCCLNCTCSGDLI